MSTGPAGKNTTKSVHWEDTAAKTASSKGGTDPLQRQKQLYPQKEEQLHSSRRNISSILAWTAPALEGLHPSSRNSFTPATGHLYPQKEEQFHSIRRNCSIPAAWTANHHKEEQPHSSRNSRTSYIQAAGRGSPPTSETTTSQTEAQLHHEGETTLLLNQD